MILRRGVDEESQILSKSLPGSIAFLSFPVNRRWELALIISNPQATQAALNFKLKYSLKWFSSKFSFDLNLFLSPLEEFLGANL